MLEDDQIVQNNDAALGASIPSSPDSVREQTKPLTQESESYMNEGRPENIDSIDSARNEFEEGPEYLPEISSDAESKGRSSKLKSDAVPILDISSDDAVDWSAGKKGKSKKKGRKVATASAADVLVKGLEELSIDRFTCNVCEVEFVSRTKLFEHVRDSGHALAGEAGGGGSGSGKKSKKGKRK
jgi:DnaJ family protein A protein 5